MVMMNTYTFTFFTQNIVILTINYLRRANQKALGAKKASWREDATLCVDNGGLQPLVAPPSSRQ